MRREDYIKGATSKIFSRSEKEMVEAELNDHILKNKAFSEEIGYDTETAEDKAVEKMGEYAEVAEYLGELHNDFYNPAGDIIGFAVWLAALGGLYYVLKEYVFDDIGAVPITLAAICISAAAYFIGAGIMLARNRIPVIIGTLLCGGATSAFIYFCAKNMSGQNISSIETLKQLLFNNIIPSSSAGESNHFALFAVLLFLIPAVITILNAIAYNIKYNNSSNTLFDNHLKKGIKNISLLLSLLLIILSALSVYKFFDYRDYLKKDYSQNYQMALDICQKCQTIDDVKNYVQSNEYDFTEIKNGTALTGYTYHSQTSDIIISTEEIENEPKNQTMFDKLIQGIGNAILKQFPESAEEQSDYYINFSVANLKYYKNGLDSLSLSVLKTPEEELDELFRFETEGHTNEEMLEFYASHSPRNLFASPSNNTLKHNSNYIFTYLTGNGKYEYDTEFNVEIYSDKRLTVDEQKKKTIEILNNNPDVSNTELARLTGAEIIPPDISYDEFISLYNSIIKLYQGTDYYTELANYKPTQQDYKSIYDKCIIFKFSDDLSFLRSNFLGEEIVIFTSETNILFVGFDVISSEDEEQDNNCYQPTNGGTFKKMYKYPIGYYGKNKCPYKDYQNVPYFDKKGTRYTFYSETDENNFPEYYLVSQKGDKCKDEFCYIDKNGYLILDKDNKIRANTDGVTYHDSDGNIYTRAFETSWDENGNIIPYEETP